MSFWISSRCAHGAPPTSNSSFVRTSTTIGHLPSVVGGGVTVDFNDVVVVSSFMVVSGASVVGVTTSASMHLVEAVRSVLSV